MIVTQQMLDGLSSDDLTFYYQTGIFRNNAIPTIDNIVNNLETVSINRIISGATTGRNIIQHNLKRKPVLVTFFSGDTQLMFEYYRGDGGLNSDPLNNIVLVADQNYNNLEINIL